ncbi:MAG: DUF2750 domain-containing protein [Saprospiraceae bacterium]|nr:DUF2750 domain-containing protein [Saprospiraceae bacterium]
MKPSEIANLFKKPGEQRYAYFLAMVAETKQVFGLSDAEGWALLGDDNDVDILPLFPNALLAEAFRKAARYEAYQVEKIEWEDLLEWLEEMEPNGMMVAILPNPRLEGAIVEPLQLKEDLNKL